MESIGVQSNVNGKRRERALSPVLRLSLLLGVLVHLAGFFVFRVLSNPLPIQEETRPFVQYVSPESLGQGAVLEEQAVLFDSAPLFVPGIWNAAHNLDLPSSDRGLLRFPLYLPPMDVAGSLLPEGLLADQAYEVSSAGDLLDLRYWDLFDGVGLGRSVVAPLPTTGVFAEVRSLKSGLVETLSTDLDILSLQATRPVHVFMRIEPDGRLLSGPTLSSRSGDTVFDEAAVEWLSRPDVVGRLPTGYQEIRIYP